MAKTNISTTSRQVELIIRQLDSVSVLPEVATAFLAAAAEKKLDRTTITEMIESDAALTAKVFALAYDKSVSYSSGRPSVKEAVASLPDEIVREIILSLKIFQPSTSNDAPLPVKNLALHCLTVACAAREISKLALEPCDRDIAFSAALLHDIGKLAIAELMPRSFEKIAADSIEMNLSFQEAEKKHLGIDHTIIGKRLAEKWRLPKEIVMAIWLHHSDTEAISDDLTAGRIAQVVMLADIIANASGIAFSGSCDTQPITPEILQSLNITNEQIETIKTSLIEKVQAKCGLLGLSNPDARTAYSQLLRETAVKLAADRDALTVNNRSLATATAHMELICQFLLAVRPEMDKIQISEIFAAAWQKHYQTGPVCVFIQDRPNQSMLEMVTLENSSDPKTLFLNVPEFAEAIPAPIKKKFAVVNACDTVKWIFDQLDFEMCKSSTMIIPLMVRQQAIGAILFEHRLPSNPADQSENLCTAATIAAGVISMTGICDERERLSEQFADILGRLKATREKLTEARSLAGVAEMAAGASHELNNPLAVISGRTQLLLDIETDENKRQMLKQIHTRADEVSQIVADLMAFARPSTPNPLTISIEDVIGSAVRETEEEYNLRKLELTLESPAGIPVVKVDAGQTAAAIKNILSNALDSYPGENGPITITVDTPKEEGFVTVRITDTGCGMDTPTLAKAMQPFFSMKPAGRKRGMGLAHARRLLDLNNAELSLQSKPQQGTTVTIKFKL